MSFVLLHKADLADLVPVTNSVYVGYQQQLCHIYLCSFKVLCHSLLVFARRQFRKAFEITITLDQNN